MNLASLDLQVALTLPTKFWVTGFMVQEKKYKTAAIAAILDFWSERL